MNTTGNLVFLHAGPTRSTVHVGDKSPSDHCFVFTVIPFGFSLEPGPEQIKPRSDEESEFLGLVSDHLSSLFIPADNGEVSMVVFHVADAVASVWFLVAKASVYVLEILVVGGLHPCQVYCPEGELQVQLDHSEQGKQMH